MKTPTYDPEMLDDLARVFAKAALDQLIQEMYADTSECERSNDTHPAIEAETGT